MDQLPLLPSGSEANTSTHSYLILDNTMSGTSTSPPVPALPPKPSRYSNHDSGTDTIKAKIMSHPLYPALLTSFIECQKVGAPPEIVGRLSALVGELDSDSRDGRHDHSPDPELDEFMEIYCDVLVRYKQELTRLIQEADQFFRPMAAQMDSFTLALDAASVHDRHLSCPDTLAMRGVGGGGQVGGHYMKPPVQGGWICSGQHEINWFNSISDEPNGSSAPVFAVTDQAGIHLEGASRSLTFIDFLKVGAT